MIAHIREELKNPDIKMDYVLSAIIIVFAALLLILVFFS